MKDFVVVVFKSSKEPEVTYKEFTALFWLAFWSLILGIFAKPEEPAGRCC